MYVNYISIQENNTCLNETVCFIQLTWNATDTTICNLAFRNSVSARLLL